MSSSRWLNLKVPETELLMATAREAAHRDADLDHLEVGLRDPETDLQTRAGDALALARGGRLHSRRALVGFAHELRDRPDGQDLLAVARLAVDLVRSPPPPWVERAEAGYRWTDPETAEVLYVEDPLAAYWHRRDRWGPPIRPWVEGPDLPAGPHSDLELLWRSAFDGVLVRVEFKPSFGPRLARLAGRPGPGSLWITRAGFAPDRALGQMVRWTQLRSLGWVEGFLGRRVGYERWEGSPETLPGNSSLPPERLLELMTRLADQARPR